MHSIKVKKPKRADTTFHVQDVLDIKRMGIERAKMVIKLLEVLE